MLTKTSIISGDSIIAQKYLNPLSQSLFYRKWAKQNNIYLSHPELAMNDHEISRNYNLPVHSDFVSNPNNLNLEDLLFNHPENKMAYEYLMASLLLDKNLDKFVRMVPMLKDYGYTRIPIHFEEALLFYNSYENKEIIPEGFSFQPETIRRFQDYATILWTYRNYPDKAETLLEQKYGKTYWFYLQFNNITY
jgi:hypothetical protein